jgi:hypothetical protein
VRAWASRQGRLSRNRAQCRVARHKLEVFEDIVGTDGMDLDPGGGGHLLVASASTCSHHNNGRATKSSEHVVGHLGHVIRDGLSGVGAGIDGIDDTVHLKSLAHDLYLVVRGSRQWRSVLFGVGCGNRESVGPKIPDEQHFYRLARSMMGSVWYKDEPIRLCHAGEDMRTLVALGRHSQFASVIGFDTAPQEMELAVSLMM